MNENYDYLFKLLVIGDSGVGKTCLLQRFTNDSFDFSMLNTIAIDFNTKMFQVDDKIVNLRIWDTAGQERFRTITYSYYRDADGIILVYDVTNQKSFESIPNWLEEAKRYAKPNVPKLLVGNKCDLKDNRVVDYQRAKLYADSVGIKLIETSAKDSINVDESFRTLIHDIITNFNEREWTHISAPPIKVAKKKSNWADNCCF